MTTFIFSAWRSGLRGRSFHAVFVLGVLLIGCAYLASEFSPRQPEAVALDVGFTGLRFSLTLMALFWVQELVSKEIERRTTILYLAYPIPRAHYILGRYAGIAVLLLVAAVVLALLLWLAVISSSETYDQSQRGALGLPYWVTVFGAWLDALVVLAFAICVASLSTVPSLPLALGAAFTVVSHSIGAVIQYLASGADGRADLVAQYSTLLNIASWGLPDLSRLDWRVWPMYDLPPQSGSLPLASLMALCYIALMLMIAILAFKHRDFD